MMNRINSYQGDHHDEPFLNNKITFILASETALSPEYMWVTVAVS